MTDNKTPDGDTETQYLFVVSYDDDAERKRVEYLFNNWDEGAIEKPDGLVRVATGVDHDSLYKRVVSRVPSQQVDSYELRPAEADIDRDRRTVSETINADIDAVESFVEYILSKRNAVLQSATHNEYDVYTKKGRADLSYELNGHDGMTDVRINITGYPPAPGFLADFFGTELSDYADSQ